ncbi:MAG: MBL fold metallo-hydrolase [Candidatus Micrarchaeota archaeon]
MQYLRYLGHSSFEILFDDTIIYLDPFFKNEVNGKPREVPCAISASDVRKADLIFISHEHAPHCDVAGIHEIVERTFATVVAPKPVLAKLKISDRFKVDVRVGDKFAVKRIDVEVTKAAHPQSQYPVGYILKKDGASIYHAGDTYDFTEMTDISADFALLPIGGSYTMDPIGAMKACKDLRAKYVVPMHYNTYDKIRQDPAEFTSKITRGKPVVLRVGERIQF